MPEPGVGLPPRFALAIIGRDRPGIVADVTGALLDLGCNIEDVATSILRGYFAMMLVVTGPPGLDQARIGVAIEPFAVDGHLRYDVWEVAEASPNSVPTHVGSVYGADRTGIVHAVAQVMAGLGVNICDMACRLHDVSQPIYVLKFEVALPPGTPEERVARELEAAASELGFQSSLGPIDPAEL